MKNYYSKITDSYDIVTSFFNNKTLYIKTFLQLVKYAYAIDREVVVRYNESIIGASKVDSVFYFYVINQDGKYLIKYKHQPEKAFFSISPESFSEMKKECKRAIEYVTEQEISSITPAEIRNDGDITFIPTVEKKDTLIIEQSRDVDLTVQDDIFQELDREFCQFYQFFEENRDVAIIDCPFPKRVKNAMGRSGIVTLGDLIDVKLSDLRKIRWLGQKGIYSIMQVCRSMYEYSDNTIGKLTEGKEKPSIVKTQINKWDSVRNAVQEAIEVGNDSVDLELEQELVNRTITFQNDIELQIKEIVEASEILTDKQKDVLVRRMVHGETYASISNDYGVTRARIQQIKHKALKKIRGILFRLAVNDEIIVKITDLFCNSDKEELCWYLSYLMNKRKDTWDCILPVISDKDGEKKLETALGNYKVIPRKDYINNSSRGKSDFYITKEERAKVLISNVSLPITTIVRNINNVIDNRKVKKLPYEAALRWLIKQGYIIEEKTQDQIIRHPTKKGVENKIILVGRPSSTKGVYYITYYPPLIQQLLVEHANEMK